MKLTKHRPPIDDSLDMTPFIDCVFLLIIFFMTCSRFATDQYEALKLPDAREGEAELPKKKTKVVVNINPAGEFLVSNENLNLRTLRLRLVKETQLSSGPENVIVLVRADREVRFEDIQRLMSTCAGAGIWQLSFAVVDEPLP